jgi:general secretion pathway protein B
MSYILDALRKSDQQRRRGAVPRLPAAPATITVLERPTFLSYGLLGIFLLEIIIAIIWLHPWRSQSPESQTDNLAIHQPSPSPSPSRRPPLPELGETSADALALLPESPQQQRSSAGPISPAYAAPVPEHQHSASATPEVNNNPINRTNLTTSIVANPATANNVRPATNADERPAVDGQEPNVMDVMAKAGRPSSLQATLPPMAIAVHAYSNRPQDRLVSINERVLREGDYLAPDLKLEQITPDGMIFNYRGNRVQRSAQ